MLGFINEIIEKAKESTQYIAGLQAYASRQQLERQMLDLGETVAELLNLVTHILVRRVKIEFRAGPDLTRPAARTHE